MNEPRGASNQFSLAVVINYLLHFTYYEGCCFPTSGPHTHQVTLPIPETELTVLLLAQVHTQLAATTIVHLYQADDN